MRPYEVMVIFDVGAEPPAIQAVVDRLLESIRGNDGVPGHVDRWGRRPFAYEVKHRREGYYVVVELSGGPKTVAEIDRLLTLADEVLRFKVIRLPDKVAARLASGASSRSGGRRPASRGDGGRGPRADGSGRSAEPPRATADHDGVRDAAGDGAPQEMAADAAAPAAG
jgi:small subunit ribosomal protein S6